MRGARRRYGVLSGLGAEPMFEFFDSQASLSGVADPDRIEESQQFGELRIRQSGARSRRQAEGGHAVGIPLASPPPHRGKDIAGPVDQKIETPPIAAEAIGGALRCRLPKRRTEPEADWSKDAANPFVEGGDAGVVSTRGRQREAVGEADALAAVTRSLTSHLCIGRQQADAEGSNRVDGGTKAALVLGRTDQCLGVVDGAEKQFVLVGGEEPKSTGRRGVVSIGAVKRRSPRRCRAHRAHATFAQARSSERRRSR